DGVTEAENNSLELFGSDRLIGWASSSALGCSAEGLAGSLLDAVKEYTGDIEQNDDITVMTVIYK
ncbi:MAG: SpoIIE family protein phosphatase, partial [Bacteroidales bacterium]|nr:SpoIIE family protein phosphatase [Bacteroidales bacterium]